MHDHKIESSNRSIKSVTNLGLLVNAALAVLKVVVGLLAGSIALIADAVHSLSDMVTDLTVLIGVRLGSKKPDEEHPYGHGRAETFSATFIALVLAAVGAAMIYYAALDIAKENLGGYPEDE